MLSLAWNVEELSELVKTGRSLRVEVGRLIDLIEDSTSDLLESNAASRLCDIKEEGKLFLKNVYTQRRVPATHIFIIMRAQ